MSVIDILAETDAQILLDGATVTILADGAATLGRYALLDVRAVRLAGTPEHVHEREDEAILVLEGELSVVVDGLLSHAHPGDHVRMPRGVPHHFTVESAEARFLVHVAPAGVEDLLRLEGGPTRAALADHGIEVR